jgi:hypothetical protein
VDVRVDFNNDEEDEADETAYSGKFADIEELKNKDIINAQAEPTGSKKMEMARENCWTGHKLRKTATYYLKQLSHLYYERDKILKSDANRHPVITFQCRAGKNKICNHLHLFILT